MSNTVVGFDIGNSFLKVAVTKKKTMQVHTIPMPDNLIKEGLVIYPAMMIDFLKDIKKDYKIKSGPCGLILPESLTIYRSMTLPPMTDRQLDINLPFEFHDYITGEPEDYIYDYCVQELVRDEEDEVTEMKLVAAAAAKNRVLEYTNMFKSAGFRVQTVLPQEVAVTNLVKDAIKKGKADASKEYCIVNIGHLSTKVYLFNGDKLIVTRTIAIGGIDFDKAISENENVDIYMAGTYKASNFNNVLEKDYCREVYTKLALEVIKVLNYYYFNNRESALDCMYFGGGVSGLTALCHSIAETTSLEYKLLRELLPDYMEEKEAADGVLAIGLLMQ